ncbi:hypothetical protein HHI36_001508 [Cryptolaemus montrouzieri]|uniref:Uncharacterized protein n=1 Tax=Cryptolaemus montrouzieri TaxID=559131 RepID=A0ABD2P8K6_9CUCU
MGDFTETQKKYLREFFGEITVNNAKKIGALEESIDKRLHDITVDVTGKIGELEVFEKRKTELLKNSYKLKGTGIFESPGLSPDERIRQKALVQKLKEVRQKGKVIDGKCNTSEQIEVYIKEEKQKTVQVSEKLAGRANNRGEYHTRSVSSN